MVIYIQADRNDSYRAPYHIPQQALLLLAPPRPIKHVSVFALGLSDVASGNVCSFCLLSVQFLHTSLCKIINTN